MSTFDKDLYNREFFEWHKTHADQYSKANMKWFLENMRPYLPRIIDLGCGIGSYLEAAVDHGVQIENVKGVDIGLPYAKEFMRPDIFERCDPFDITVRYHEYFHKFDVVLCFETAEHIDPAKNEIFCSIIADAFDPRGYTSMLLFSAAPPGQEGCGHINCRPKDDWIKDLGYYLNPKGIHRRLDLEAEIIHNWGLQGAPYYITQNLIVFAR